MSKYYSINEFSKILGVISGCDKNIKNKTKTQ